MYKRLLALLLALAMIFALAACGGEKADNNENTEDTANTPANNTSDIGEPSDAEIQPEDITQPTDDTVINLGLLKGPTGIGAVYLMEESTGLDITLASAPDEITSALISGSLDIAAVPTNVAATLYNKTDGGVTMLALNTLGVLYILENGDSVHSVSDLAGRTIYATGQGSNPEYVLNYILRQNSLEPGTDVTVEYLASDELAARMSAGEIDLCMLPVPNATAVQMKNQDVRTALSLTDEWNALENGSKLTMGCIVARTEFLEEHGALVDNFLNRYAESIEKVNAGKDEVFAAVAANELVGSEAVAKAALPQCNITFISGSDIYAAINGYYTVLFDADPTSIGGSIPDESFYYTGSK